MFARSCKRGIIVRPVGLRRQGGLTSGYIPNFQFDYKTLNIQLRAIDTLYTLQCTGIHFEVLQRITADESSRTQTQKTRRNAYLSSNLYFQLISPESMVNFCASGIWTYMKYIIILYFVIVCSTLCTCRTSFAVSRCLIIWASNA